MILTNISPATGLASLGLALATGIWIGYRYALESKKMDAVIAHALDGVDTSWEDEAPAPTPARDWNWDVENWWGKTSPCPCGADHGGWAK